MIGGRMSDPKPLSKTPLDLATQSVEPAIPADTVVAKARPRDPTPVRRGRFFALRREIPIWQSLLFAAMFIALVACLWFAVTRGTGEERIISPYALPSPEETFDYFYPEMWIGQELTRNTFASLRRVGLGFLLAAAVGIPLGILCGCFNWFNAFLLPMTLFGRNIPIVALVPLMFTFFGATEMQKVMFIFVAAVAFVIIDSATAIRDVDNRYIDTAYTLVASRWQIVRKVLVPLAMPSIFNSLRLLFGLAFGYIMLAEAIKFGDEAGGLGNIIITSQRRNVKEPIYLILLIIPLVALAIDRVLYWIQRQLFPHQYASDGVLHALVRVIAHGIEDLKALVIPPKQLEAAKAAIPASGGKQ
jgi:ABC-type nitrate/sulfonate/bicarbonate transport system permease component